MTPEKYESIDVQHDNNGLSQYFKDLKPHLPKRYYTKEEERELLAAGKTEELFYSVALMVASIAYKKATEKTPVMELIQIGNMAVIERTIPNFNPDRGKLTTLAPINIQHAMNHELKKGFRDYKISPKTVDEVKRVQRIWDTLSAGGDEPSYEEVAKRTGFKPSKVAFLRNIGENDTLSMNYENGEEGGAEFGELLVDNISAQNSLYGHRLENFIDDKALIRKSLTEIVEEIENIGLKKPAYKEVLEQRMGLFDGILTGNGATFQEIADNRGVTRTRIQQLQRYALRHFKNKELSLAVYRYLSNEKSESPKKITPTL